MKNDLKAIDIFAGAGGFTFAAKEIGINIIAAIENDKYACDTYRYNFIDRKEIKHPPVLFQEDIELLEPNKMMKKINIKKGSIDILMGGPPCQGYSKHRLKDTGVNDPRNRLLLRYFDYVKIIQPKTFIIENVPGLLWERHKKYLNKFYTLAEKANYNVFPPVKLNAKDFGVPQNRQRIFILGINTKLNLNIEWPPAQTHFDPLSDEVRKNKKNAWVNAEIVFKKRILKDDENNKHMNHSQELIEVFKSTPKNGGSRDESNRILPCHQKHSGHKDVYGRINIRKPGPTITTGCINPSKGRFVHPIKNHGITVRHAARFQDFPDTFIFKGGLMAGGKQVGNAVPIKLGKIILKTISKSLYKNRGLYE